MNKVGFFTLVSLMAAFLFAGCASKPAAPLYENVTIVNELTAPIYFSNYHDLFRYIAINESYGEIDSETVSENHIFQLAADSEIDVFYEENLPPVYVITVHDYDIFNNGKNVDDGVRGDTGNGRFYLLIPWEKSPQDPDNPDPGFVLVGIADGSGYRWSSLNHVPRFIAAWNVSASEAPESVYEWNGKVFKLITKESPDH